MTRSTGSCDDARRDSSTNLDISVPTSFSAWYMRAVAQAVNASLKAWRLHPFSRLRANSTVRSASPRRALWIRYIASMGCSRVVISAVMPVLPM